MERKMAVILQIDFAFQGPFGNDLAAAMSELAESISREPGLTWKIWTEDPENQRAGGVYLFSDQPSAQAFQTKHLERLKSFGITEPRSLLLGVNEALTEITSGPV